ncbi:MAG: hypothetical protein K1V97_00385 [Lachnospiraceae bacterium]
MLKTYSLKRDGNTRLSAHFQVKEFKCKDGSDKIIVNMDLINLLEQLYDKLGAGAINITSGYRTPSHSVKVGGYATDQHTKGNAADITAKKKDGTPFSSKDITLALEDLNHAGGIGLINKNGSVHLDVRGKKCWFDETNGEKLVQSWYAYWGIAKPSEKVIGTYYPREDLNVRKGSGVGYAVTEKNGAKYNTAYPVYEIKRVGSQDWGRIGVNRWICLAYCSSAPITAANPAHKGTAYTITCDMLKVRKSPSTLSKQVGHYTRGETFYVIARKGDWCQLESGNWMCAGKYLKRV